MKNFRRYAIFYTPSACSWSNLATQCLGWDSTNGSLVTHPEISNLPRSIDELTQRPRKYGLHGTIKAPFRLAKEVSEQDLNRAVKVLANNLQPLTFDGLELRMLDQFLALTIVGDQTGLATMAATVVRTLDHFRAPLTAGELEKRRLAGLTARQEQLLAKWGYPYVLDQFKFHMTLTGKLSSAEANNVQALFTQAISPLLPGPFLIDTLSLLGEGDDGFFHLIDRYELSAQRV